MTERKKKMKENFLSFETIFNRVLRHLDNKKKLAGTVERPKTSFFFLLLLRCVCVCVFYL
jgi:hypothetical protein